jgi:squalene-hopene/tetraprenyl-beta-curcumene cyclase
MPNSALIAAAVGLFLAGTSTTVAVEPPVASPPLDAKAYQRAVDRAIEFLKTKGQAAEGSYAAHTGIGVTAVATTGIMRHGRSPDDPLVAKSLKYLEGFVQGDGGVYVPGTFYQNYETCLAILCFTEANRGGRYSALLKNAEKFVKKIQWGEGEDQSSPSYGGAGYGQQKRPDLSNTNFLIEALRAAGDGPDDEAMKKALIFVSRCQNLESEYNTTPFAAKNPDGGFYYTPAGGGVSMAGQTSQGGLRSYGSMTYAGLKSMIYAGVGPEDPRVKAALKWIQKHYDVRLNPGMGDAGLYYYYHTFAKALDAVGLKEVEDADGVKHDWRRGLLQELVRRQQPDGSWINENSRWLEGDPCLVTGYVLLTLDYCRPTGRQAEEIEKK